MNIKISESIMILIFVIGLSSCENSAPSVSRQKAQEASIPDEEGYLIDIQKQGDKYIHYVSWHRYSKIQGGTRIEDGAIGGYDPLTFFSGYDTSILDFSGKYIIPKKVGSTRLIVGAQDHGKVTPDTVLIEVKSKNGDFFLTTKRSHETVPNLVK